MAIQTLQPDVWRHRERLHTERAARLTADRRYRAQRRIPHPIDDFIWDYYELKPRNLTRWHPGVGVALDDDGALDWRSSARWALVLPDGGFTLDPEAFLADRERDVHRIHTLLTVTSSRSARFDCFGGHEWAMVYRLEEHRHPLPLRLGQEGTDAVVETMNLSCTHFDAFRFFTPSAVPLNAHQPTRSTQNIFEQTGCLHANMDLLKWALTLGPAVPGELLLDTFEFAYRIRQLDMAASPYDCTSLGLEPVRVETQLGRAEYVRRQRAFSRESMALRQRLLEVTSALLGDGPTAA